MKKIKQVLFFLSVLAIASCNRGFEPIEYGKDACADCKMTIVDRRFAAELIDKKGKIFKFDDLLCLKQYISNHTDQEVDQVFIEPYLDNEGQPLNAQQAVYLQHEFFGSPMNGNYAAFPTPEESQRLQDSLGITALNWDNVK